MSGAEAPGNQSPQRWLTIHCIGPVAYKDTRELFREHYIENKVTFWTKIHSSLRVKGAPVDGLAQTGVRLLASHSVVQWRPRPD